MRAAQLGALEFVPQACDVAEERFVHVLESLPADQSGAEQRAGQGEGVCSVSRVCLFCVPWRVVPVCVFRLCLLRLVWNVCLCICVVNLYKGGVRVPVLSAPIRACPVCCPRCA